MTTPKQSVIIAELLWHYKMDSLVIDC